MKERVNKLFKLFLGTTLASFSIACVVQSGLGMFPTTCANFALANWLGITVGTAGFLVELIILAIVYYLGEGVSVTGIINMTLGSFLIDVFIWLLPTNKLMIIGLLLSGFAWALQGSAGLGETNNNLLVTAILKRCKVKIGTLKAIQEVTYLIIGFIGARNTVTLFTLILSFGIGYLIQIEYKLAKFDPTKIKQSFLIKRKHA
jgi:uncharacterized membrane protein YczE